MKRRFPADDWVLVDTPQELDAAVKQNSPRYIFLLHWNWILPEKIWSNWDCICFHMTDLPYGRGGSPLQNLIVAGHKATALCAFKVVDEVDAGPIYIKSELSLEGSAYEIYQRAARLSWDMIEKIIAENPEPVRQKGPVVRFLRRVPAQSLLPSKGSIEGIYDHIRMLDAPTYPAAFIEHGDYKLKFANARLEGGVVKADVIIAKARKESKE